MKRLMVRTDEEKCDRCGLCVAACTEGALQIVDGKARLVGQALARAEAAIPVDEVVVSTRGEVTT